MIERIGPGTCSFAPPSEATVVATIAPSIHARGRFSHAKRAPPAVPTTRVRPSLAASGPGPGPFRHAGSG